MNVFDMNIPAKRLLLGGVAVLGVVALTGCGGGGGTPAAATGGVTQPTQLSLAALRAGRSVSAGTYTISGDRAEIAAIYAALVARGSTGIPGTTVEAGGIKLRCSGAGCGIVIDEDAGTITVTGTIEVAATGGTFPSERTAPPSGDGNDGGDDDNGGTEEGDGGDGNGGMTEDGTTPSDPPADPEMTDPVASVTGMVAQDGRTATFTITLTKAAPEGGVTVSYRVGSEDPQEAMVPVGQTSIPVTEDTSSLTAGQSLTVTLVAGDGYTVLADGTETDSVTIPSGDTTTTPLSDVLGAMDQAALNTAVEGVSKPVITGQSSICGNVSECATIVNKLEEQAKKYAPLSREQLHAETVGSETFGNVFGRSDSGDWAIEVDRYRFLLSDAINNLEAAAPPSGRLADGDIASAVRAAVGSSSFPNFVWGRNGIASGFVDGGTTDGAQNPDPWGVWIKEGDANALRYWHAEGGTAVTSDRAAFFRKYANAQGTATYNYSGDLHGYAHYTDSDDSTQEGTFGATVNLEANFGADSSADASITGTVTNFSGTASSAGWGDVTLNADYTAEGGTTAPNAVAGDASGHWSPDFVYGDGVDTSGGQPDGIAGRVGLTFTANSDTGAAAGAAAGAFNAD